MILRFILKLSKEDGAMKKYIFFTFIITNILCINNIASCPCGFSPDDKRPFFEQYETEIKTVTPQEKEKK